jgi:anti-sigma B factor antagonist
MNLQIETRYPREGVALLRTEGELDVYTSPQLKQTLVDLMSRGVTRFILDLNGVEYVDSTGLGVLIGALRRAADRDGCLKLLCDNSRVRRIFEITGLTKVFDICASEAEALQQIPAR